MCCQRANATDTALTRCRGCAGKAAGGGAAAVREMAALKKPLEVLLGALLAPALIEGDAKSFEQARTLSPTRTHSRTHTPAHTAEVSRRA